MMKNIDIDLMYQQALDAPPITPEQMQANAQSNDSQTMNHWRETWLENTRKNKEFLGSFAQHSIGQLQGINRHGPAIIIGSGPSLKDSIKDLKLNQAMKHPLTTISCLHNFGYFQDEGVKIDYFLSLDSGEIIFKDIYEGRNQTAEEYWAMTADKTLLAYVGSPPELFQKWQGKIYVFNTLVPDEGIRKSLDAIERFTHYVGCGGNALGACLYIAKIVFGSAKILFVGADFCFSYDNQFHSYKTSYDTLGGIVLHPDVFGIPRKTWMSYLNFKFWFDRVAITIPGEYVNCSYGLLGAYLGGNIRHFQYMSLETALVPYQLAEEVLLMNDKGDKTIVDLKEYYNNPQGLMDLVIF